MGEPWRYRCPEGHANIINRSETYRCRSCEETYIGDPLAAGGDDADGGAPVQCDERVVLDQLVATVEGPLRSRAKSGELEDNINGTSRMIGHRLAKLESAGLVERIEVSHSGNWWRPTEAGIEQAERAELTPIGAGLLVFGLGVVYLVVLLIFNGGLL